MKERIRADLEKLHREIQSLDDAAARQAMNGLVSDIEQQLAGSGSSVEEIRGQVERAVTRFEAGHPKMVAILQNILNALAGMGI